MRRTKVMPALIATGTAVALAVTGTTAWAATSAEEAGSSHAKDESDLDMDVELLPPTVTDDGESVAWEPVVHNNSGQTVETRLILVVDNIDDFGDNAVQFEEENIPGPEPDSTAAEEDEDIWCQMGADDGSASSVYCWMTLPPGEYVIEKDLRLQVMHPDKADFSDSPAIDARGKLLDESTSPPADIDHESQKLPLEHVE